MAARKSVIGANVFKLGNLVVSVRPVGTSFAPWEGRSKVFEYKVLVRDSHSGAMYRAPAWGSINDYQQNRHDFKGIGAMVVEELLMANSNPEDFISTPASKKEVEHIIQAAETFEYDELLEAVGEAIQKGYL